MANGRKLFYSEQKQKQPVDLYQSQLTCFDAVLNDALAVLQHILCGLWFGSNLKPHQFLHEGEKTICRLIDFIKGLKW